MRRLWPGLIVLAALSGGCVLVASKADYTDYRAVRLANDPSTRALAMRSYVDKHPGGRWHDEVEAARKSEELRTFEAGKDTRLGIEQYLQAYPDGTYVAMARSRLRAIELIEQQRKQADQEAQQLAAARKVRAEELRRTWLGRFLGYWIKTLVELKGWGEPIADVARQNPQFSRAFGALPRPRCTKDECVKYYTSSFAVPVPGGNRIERKLSLLLRLTLRSGKLERAELLLPDRGFSRWYELEQRHEVSSGERAARTTAVDWALARTEPIVRGASDGLAPLGAASAPSIEPPTIGPTGELLDTSIEAPTDPQNLVQGEDNAGIGVAANKAPDGSPEGLVKPEQRKPAADMVFDPMGVNKQGQRIDTPAGQAPQPAADGGNATEMLFTAPLEVPKEGPGSSQVSAPAEKTPDTSEPIAPVARGYQGLGLHLTLFAAGSDGTGYDGVLIERATGKGGKPAAAVKPPQPTAAAPANAAPSAAKPAQPPAAAPANAAASAARPASAPATNKPAQPAAAAPANAAANAAKPAQPAAAAPANAAAKPAQPAAAPSANPSTAAKPAQPAAAAPANAAPTAAKPAQPTPAPPASAVPPAPKPAQPAAEPASAPAK